MARRGGNEGIGQGRRRLRQCLRAMNNASDYAAWHAAASEHDRLRGMDAWRHDDASEHYDAALLRQDLRRIQALSAVTPLDQVADILHESLHRHLNDVLSPGLYTVAATGTKHLVSSWLDAVEALITRSVAADVDGWNNASKLAVIERAAQNLGRTALLLSGGATLGFYHLGVIRALWKAQLLPEVVVGASMGALIAAGVCARPPHELDEFFEPDVPDIERIGLRWRKVGDVLRGRSMMDPARLLQTIETNCGRFTFAEAYERSGRVLNISLMPTRKRQKPRILNHLTAPDVWVPVAALASAAVPGLFPPVALTRRGPDGDSVPYVPGETWIDGSFGADLPTMRVSRLHNVNHFVVSQTQPHALPMLAGVKRRGLVGVTTKAFWSVLENQGAQLLNVGRRMAARTALGRSMELAYGLVGQPMRGDIDIHPRFDPKAYRKLLSNPTAEDLTYFVREGARGTWAKVEQIRRATQISRCLWRCKRQLEGRVALGG